MYQIEMALVSCSLCLSVYASRSLSGYLSLSFHFSFALSFPSLCLFVLCLSLLFSFPFYFFLTFFVFVLYPAQSHSRVTPTQVFIPVDRSIDSPWRSLQIVGVLQETPVTAAAPCSSHFLWVVPLTSGISCSPVVFIASPPMQRTLDSVPTSLRLCATVIAAALMSLMTRVWRKVPLFLSNTFTLVIAAVVRGGSPSSISCGSLLLSATAFWCSYGLEVVYEPVCMR